MLSESVTRSLVCTIHIHACTSIYTHGSKFMYLFIFLYLFTRYSPVGAESVSRSIDNTTKDTTKNDNGKSNDILKKNSNSISKYDSISQDISMKIAQKSDPIESFAFPFPPKYFKFPKPENNTESTEITSFPLAQKYYNHMEMLLNCLHKLSCNSLGINDENYMNDYYNLECNHSGYRNNNDNGIINNDAPNPDSNSGPGPGLEPDLSPDSGQTRATGCALKFSYYHSPLKEAENLVNDASISKDINNANIYNNDNTNHIRYGEHTDYLGFTILRPDPYDWTNIPLNKPSNDSKISPISSNISVDNIDNNCGGNTELSTDLSTDVSTNCYYTTGGLEVKIKIDDEEYWVPIKLPLLNDLSSYKSLLLSSSSLPSQIVSPSLLPPPPIPPSLVPSSQQQLQLSSLPPSPSSFPLIVNAGDLMQMWTNDRWISPLHR